uniref:Transmembrane protein n=1 Tax=Strongyloides venezuelensis TaxID=75913 RepID=A0A0K0F3P2_STRVS
MKSNKQAVLKTGVCSLASFLMTTVYVRSLIHTPVIMKITRFSDSTLQPMIISLESKKLRREKKSVEDKSEENKLEEEKSMKKKKVNKKQEKKN